MSTPSFRASCRRVHIPKGDGKQTRPIGIPTFEDKVLQRAVSMLLEAVYEQDFYDFSYGFRPGRSAHQALERMQNGLVKMAGGWVLEVDIRKFFDTLGHEHMMEMLRHRVRDGVLLRLIGKWLNAGVLEGLELSYPETGTPQGGVISPLLANIYLHEVLDDWFVREVQPKLSGRAWLIRYADDFVIVFERQVDATRVHEVLPKRRPVRKPKRASRGRARIMRCPTNSGRTKASRNSLLCSMSRALMKNGPSTVASARNSTSSANATPTRSERSKAATSGPRSSRCQITLSPSTSPPRKGRWSGREPAPGMGFVESPSGARTASLLPTLSLR